ncbi:Uma2 family endonuclease [Nonomuraea typhae]|uniref:Uma2 family endonuclease n=1 Tax=Nonomuraea typhae TaxID=2603600 RepID=UPI0012F73D82|nr:Uma2 family endonuclease [Nonomuraea typhae]
MADWDAYLALDEETQKEVEIVDGAFIPREPRGRGHQTTARRLADALEAAIRGSRAEVNTSIEVILGKAPLHIRKPDVVVHSRLELGEWLHAKDVIMAVEVLSPHSITRDRLHKADEYAMAGIPHYLIVQPDDQGVVSVEHHVLVCGAEYCKPKITHRDLDGLALRMTTPFRLDIDWSQLDIGPM